MLRASHAGALSPEDADELSEAIAIIFALSHKMPLPLSAMMPLSIDYYCHYAVTPAPLLRLFYYADIFIIDYCQPPLRCAHMITPIIAADITLMIERHATAARSAILRMTLRAMILSIIFAILFHITPRDYADIIIITITPLTLFRYFHYLFSRDATLLLMRCCRDAIIIIMMPPRCCRVITKIIIADDCRYFHLHYAAAIYDDDADY